MMKTTLLLLLSTAALLVSPAPSKSLSDIEIKREIILNDLLDSVDNYSRSNPKKFVEDITPLAKSHNKCEYQFFCKAEQIFAKLDHSGKVFLHLSAHNKDYKTVCDQLNLMDKKDKAKDKEISILQLVELLISCVQHVNFNRKSS